MSATPQADQGPGLLCELVLTGGPGGGKTASLEFLRAALGPRGYRVLVVPETATMLYTHGVPDVGQIVKTDRALYVATQETIMRTCRDIGASFRAYAARFQQPVVLVYDRAELDCAAYLTPEEFKGVLKRVGTSSSEILSRYDGVIHLKTSAGSPFGDMSNNAGRRERGSSEAKAACKRTLDAWSGHPHLTVIPATTSFDVKLGQIFNAVAETIARVSAERAGQPKPRNARRRA